MKDSGGVIMSDSDWATRAAKNIWADLKDRRGFGLETLEYDDPNQFNKIQTTHTQLIHKAAEAAGGKSDET